ncbi:MAG: hypothetical protein ACRC9E_16075 [Plesiomonas shigelloides]
MINDFNHGGEVYSLSHLTPSVISVERAATDTHDAKTVKFFVSYSDHCFTKHYAEGGDESLLYEDSHRYFCPERYACSLSLPELIPSLIQKNIVLGLTMYEHRESFFYLEEHYMGVLYRLFFDIAPSKHPASDIRLKVKSAYPQDSWASDVGVRAYFSFWRVVDARLSGESLAVRSQQRRRRR